MSVTMCEESDCELVIIMSTVLLVVLPWKTLSMPVWANVQGDVVRIILGQEQPDHDCHLGHVRSHNKRQATPALVSQVSYSS